MVTAMDDKDATKMDDKISKDPGKVLKDTSTVFYDSRVPGSSPPEGWGFIAGPLHDFSRQIDEVVQSPVKDHKDKRLGMWKISRLEWEKNRFIYELYVKKKVLSHKLFCWLLKNNLADGRLIKQWTVPGYEYLCCVNAINKRHTHFNTASVCRVPLKMRVTCKQIPCVLSGCISCCNGDEVAGGPIWWDTPCLADNGWVNWAREGKPALCKNKLIRSRDDSGGAEPAAELALMPPPGKASKKAVEEEPFDEYHQKSPSEAKEMRDLHPDLHDFQRDTVQAAWDQSRKEAMGDKKNQPPLRGSDYTWHPNLFETKQIRTSISCQVFVLSVVFCMMVVISLKKVSRFRNLVTGSQQPLLHM